MLVNQILAVDQTDGMITAVAGKGAVSSGKGNTGYYSGGGSTDGKKARQEQERKHQNLLKTLP